MKQNTLNELKGLLDLYEMDYEIVISDYPSIYINHKDKKITLGSVTDETLNFKQFISKQLFHTIVEVEMHKKYPEVIKNPLFSRIEDKKAIEIFNFVKTITFPYQIEESFLLKLYDEFLVLYFGKGTELIERFKLEKEYNINLLCEIVEKVVQKSTLNPIIKFRYDIYEKDCCHVLGTYLFDTIEIYIGNIIYAFSNKYHNFDSLEQYVESVIAHELGHMDKQGSTYTSMAYDNHRLLMLNINKGDNKAFDTLFIRYAWYLFKEEKRAWNVGINFCINEETKKRLNEFKFISLKNYVKYLKNYRKKLMDEFCLIEQPSI